MWTQLREVAFGWKLERLIAEQKYSMFSNTRWFTIQIRFLVSSPLKVSCMKNNFNGDIQTSIRHVYVAYVILFHFFICKKLCGKNFSFGNRFGIDVNNFWLSEVTLFFCPECVTHAVHMIPLCFLFGCNRTLSTSTLS